MGRTEGRTEEVAFLPRLEKNEMEIITGRTRGRGSSAEGTAGAKVLKQKSLATLEDQGEGNPARQGQTITKPGGAMGSPVGFLSWG